MQFDLVSPERKLASADVAEVDLPGAEGDFTAMPEHAPVLTTLRPGILTAKTSGGSDSYVVSGGFVEVTGDAVSVLAEWAVHIDDANSDHIQQLVDEAEAATEGRTGAELDAAQLRVHHARSLLEVITRGPGVAA